MLLQHVSSYLTREQVVSGVHPGRCHLLPLKNKSSRQAPPSLATNGSLQFSTKCGAKLRLLLQACDESGTALTSGGDKFEAAATCLADGTVSQGAAVVEDNADGTYDISVSLSRTGLHSLTCQFGGCSVSAFPVNISVTGSSMAAPADFGPCCAVASDVNVSDAKCTSSCSARVFTLLLHLHAIQLQGLHLTPISQLVRLAAGNSLTVRLLLQTPELIPISLTDPADGGKIHTLISPRLHLKSDDGKTEVEVQGIWQLPAAGSFCTCTFELLKAGKYSAGGRLVCLLKLFQCMPNTAQLFLFCTPAKNSA